MNKFVNIHGRSWPLVKINFTTKRGIHSVQYQFGKETVWAWAHSSQLTDTPLPEQQCVRQGC